MSKQLKAAYVTEIKVADPDSGTRVTIGIYKDPESRGLFGVEKLFLIIQLFVRDAKILKVICWPAFIIPLFPEEFLQGSIDQAIIPGNHHAILDEDHGGNAHDPVGRRNIPCFV